MKVAKNMDSVFANCTQDELDFDVLFADDDTIIDFIAGVDEAGVPLTGPDFDYTAILAEAEDMLKDPDDEKEREGKVAHNGAAEGSKDVDLEVGAEVGDGKEVTGKEKSGESEAHDMVKLGSETAKNVAVQKAMEIAAKKFADKECCKENSEYEGYEELIEAVVNNIMSEEEIMSENANDMAIATADYLIKECEDQAARDGKVDPDNKGNIEGVKGEVIDQQTKGAATGDPIADDCDQAARDGKVVPDKNVEGVANRIMGAALESAIDKAIEKLLNEMTESETFLNEMTEAEKDKYIVDRLKKYVIPLIKNEKDPENKKALIKRAMSQLKYLRSVPASTLESATGDIHKDIETQTLDAGVESMNKDIVPDDVRANTDANKIEPDVVNTQEAVSHEDHVEDAYKELVGGMKVGLQKLALADAMDESVMETVANICEFAEENKVSFCECEGFDTVVESVIAAMTEDQINMENAAQFAIETAEFIIQEYKNEIVPVPGTEKVDRKIGQKAKIIGKNVADWAKKHPGKVAAGAGAAALGTGAVIAAKKIADKKKAANKEEVNKENYEYPEYTDLIEAVIGCFTEEEVMAENASEFACEVANYLIEAQMIDCKVVDGKAVETVGSKVKNVAGKVGTIVKNNPGKTATVAGTAAVLGTGAAIAAKKIADKKKAAKEADQEVKENFEYEEYKSLVEAIINDFSKEEVMAENASEMACTIADILIEKAMDAEDLLTNDDDDADIEAIAGNNDPKVDLHYDYDDDELIDMVVNDTNL